jgi:glycosyltransferase involved in cell wall biosynthesis
MYSPAVGGAEMHVQKLSEGLAALGHEVRVVTSNVAGVWSPTFANLPALETLNGVQVERLHPEGGSLGDALRAWQRARGGYRSSKLVFGGDGADLICAHPALLQLIPYLVKSRVDIVSAFNYLWPPAYHAYLARKLKRFKMVAVPLFHPAEDWAHRPVHKKMLANCTGAIVNTAYEAKFVLEQARIPVAIAGVGVDPKPFEGANGEKIRARYKLGSFPVVGFVGRQEARKGMDTVVRAMRTVWKTNRDVRLLLAGFQPNRDRQLESLMESLSNFEKERVVRIRDFPEGEKASIFDALDVFVMPSLAESFGMAYLDAWMCRKPVIGARIGSTECVVDEGRDGLLVTPRSGEETAAAILSLLSDPARREAMGRKGYEKVVGEFTWERVTKRVEKFYVQLSAPKNGHLPVPGFLV